MPVAEALVTAGTEAVLTYRRISGIQQDNETPEIFLGGFVAPQIFNALGLHAHVERSYTLIANELGAPIDAGMIRTIGGYRADLALYDDGSPVAIIEFKIMDDGVNPAAVIADRDKMNIILGFCEIECFVGVFVTDVDGMGYNDRIVALEAALGQPVIRGPAQRSADDNWQWCFVACQTA